MEKCKECEHNKMPKEWCDRNCVKTLTCFDVKKIRLTMCLSQSQFAKEIGITQGTIAKIEMGTMFFHNKDLASKYAEKIQQIFDSWKQQKIALLQQEIDFIKLLY
jgi:DNA-binding XRE family transcriptional regulator